MRFRGMPVITNTPPRTQQRSPGPMQANGIVEPLLTKAPTRSASTRRDPPPELPRRQGASMGPSAGRQAPLRHERVREEAIDRGIAEFDWATRKGTSGTAVGSKVRGVGLAVGPHGAGSVGYDGLMIIRPDGKLHVHSGIGNLGTHSVIDIARVAADILLMPWKDVESSGVIPRRAFPGAACRSAVRRRTR
jgi:hypothetical protein